MFFKVNYIAERWLNTIGRKNRSGSGMPSLKTVWSDLASLRRRHWTKRMWDEALQTSWEGCEDTGTPRTARTRGLNKGMHPCLAQETTKGLVRLKPREYRKVKCQSGLNPLLWTTGTWKGETVRNKIHTMIWKGWASWWFLHSPVESIHPKNWAVGGKKSIHDI